MPLRRISSLLSCFAVLVLSGCTKSDSPIAPESGDWMVKLQVATFDEFNRAVPSAGPMQLTLSAKDRIIHAVMDSGTTYSFTHLPYQQYLLTVQKEGFYPAQTTSFWSQYNHVIEMTAALYPLPGPMMRIDSIRSMVNTTVPQVYLRLFTPQVLPTGGWSRRSAVMFAGLAPDVSARYGMYTATMTAIQRTGASDIQTDDVYGALRAGGITPGMKVYVTARLMTEATTAWRDVKSGVMHYSNLEENSHAVSSFIMP